MSALTLFRKEALKQQYKARVYDEAAQAQSQKINKVLYVMLGGIGFLLAFVLACPVHIAKLLAATPLELNYIPVVFPEAAIVERLYVQDGDEVFRDMPISQLRYFKSGNINAEYETVRSPANGCYFQMAASGRFILPFQQIGKLLKEPRSGSYVFWVESNNALIEKNQSVSILSSGARAKGYITSVASFLNGKAKITIRLHLPFDKTILNPNLPIKIIIEQRSESILTLVRGVQ